MTSTDPTTMQTIRPPRRSMTLTIAGVVFALGIMIGSGVWTPAAHAQQDKEAVYTPENTPVQIYQVQPPTAQIRNGDLTWAVVGAADGRYYIIDHCGIARRAELESGADVFWRDPLIEATEIHIDAR